MRKGDQAAHPARRLDPVDGGAVALVVEVEDRATQAPALGCNSSQQAAHEAEARGMGSAQPGQVHDFARWAKDKWAVAKPVVTLWCHGRGPNDVSKKSSQLRPMIRSTSSSAKPMAASPAAMFAKSRLLANQSVGRGQPALLRLPSP